MTLLLGNRKAWDFMKCIVSFLVFATSFAGVQVAAQTKRPSILGVAHIAYYVSDLNKARSYYEDFLGFREAFALKNADGSDHAAFVKINDHQFIELIAEPPKNHGFLHDVAGLLLRVDLTGVGDQGEHREVEGVVGAIVFYTLFAIAGLGTFGLLLLMYAARRW